MSSLTHWITSLTSMGTSLAWASPLTTGEHDEMGGKQGRCCLLVSYTGGFG